MTANGWLQILLFLALIFAMTKPLGIFMARVFNREHTFLDPVLRPVEKLLYRLTMVDENHEMPWTEYAYSMLLFSGVSMFVLYLFQRLQAVLPWNPQKFPAVAQALAATLLLAAAAWGVKIVSLDTGRTIFERDAQKLLKPASNAREI